MSASVYIYIYILYTGSEPKSPGGKLYWNPIATNCLIKVSSCTRSPIYRSTSKRCIFYLFFIFRKPYQKKQNSKVMCTVFFRQTFGIVLSNILYLIVFVRSYTYSVSTTKFDVNFDHLSGPYVFHFAFTVLG